MAKLEIKTENKVVTKQVEEKSRNNTVLLELTAEEVVGLYALCGQFNGYNDFSIRRATDPIWNQLDNILGGKAYMKFDVKPCQHVNVTDYEFYNNGRVIALIKNLKERIA